ncbi:Thiol:disulfide interchange protein tlpA [Granulibacter bethesdensis]|uniref:Thiol:disulfide interchange protein tlpA n=2 Tax=Granulibacter bethesdensis TaxID=364410 RepID=A0AAN0VEZ8_9PROT|nr:Thiol:disulfide interchange protein tlpA [Granulibacter bethesdensis]APH58562.1 Thiol:disulfide interchange protein tlpA [Granulibacter bethesdensis]
MAGCAGHGDWWMPVPDRPPVTCGCPCPQPCRSRLIAPEESNSMIPSPPPSRPVWTRRLLLSVPLVLAVAAGAAFLGMLHGMEDGHFDPRGVPSPLIGKPVPVFDLPAQTPSPEGFTSAALTQQGHPVLVNFFASWCVPCKIEQPALMALKQRGIALWGIAYKDKPEAAAAMLKADGNPYQRIARDTAGGTAIDWGVYGVPETYFVDPKGIVRWKWAGPLTEQVIKDQIEPLLKAYP